MPPRAGPTSMHWRVVHRGKRAFVQKFRAHKDVGVTGVSRAPKRDAWLKRRLDAIDKEAARVDKRHATELAKIAQRTERARARITAKAKKMRDVRAKKNAAAGAAFDKARERIKKIEAQAPRNEVHAKQIKARADALRARALAKLTAAHKRIDAATLRGESATRRQHERLERGALSANKKLTARADRMRARLAKRREAVMAQMQRHAPKPAGGAAKPAAPKPGTTAPAPAPKPAWAGHGAGHVPSTERLNVTPINTNSVPRANRMLAVMANKRVEATVDAIAAVHRAPTDMKPVVSVLKSKTTRGDFTPSTGRVRLNLNTGSAITFAHELGHYLDDVPSMRDGSRAYLATHDPQHGSRQVMNAIWQSGGAQALAAIKADPSHPAVSSPDRTFARNMRNHVAYLNQPHELFARAYAQYIATRSHNADMLSELSHVQRHTNTLTRLSQWDHEDFKPIAEAFDNYFRQRGLLVE